MRRHLVSTPIGCLDDISARAKTVLQFASLILAEDTRTTGLLLNRYVSGRHLFLIEWKFRIKWNH